MPRILEIGGYAAGYCGRLFARQGAEVVRIETSRSPAWASDEAMDLYLHAGKKRIGTADKGLMASLAAEADMVVVEAESANALEQLGFSEWDCNIKASITPFGRTGPRCNWHATPSVLLAMGGYTNLVGDPDRAPLTLPGHYVEFQSGAITNATINACHLADMQDDVDLSMLETVMSLSQFTTVRWHCAGEIRERHGSDFYWVIPSDLFACKDGWVYINIVPSFWDAFTVFVDLPQLLFDPRFETNDLRRENRAALREMTAEVMLRYTREELMARSEETRIPLGVVQTLEDVLNDQHLDTRTFWETATLDGRPVHSPGIPWRIGDDQRPDINLTQIESENSVEGSV